MTVSIDFTWHKDAGGYHLTKMPMPTGKSPENWIVPNGGELISIRPMEMTDALYMIFANVDSPDGMLGFVEKFGMLASADFEFGGHRYRGMRVEKYLELAALFREALRQKASGPEQLAAFLKSIEIPRFGRVVLTPDRVVGASIKIMAINLKSALWMQLAQNLASNIKLSTCLQCGQLFEVGAGTGRRADVALLPRP
jgi:hypothetical protein